MIEVGHSQYVTTPDLKGQTNWLDKSEENCSAYTDKRQNTPNESSHKVGEKLGLTVNIKYDQIPDLTVRLTTAESQEYHWDLFKNIILLLKVERATASAGWDSGWEEACPGCSWGDTSFLVESGDDHDDDDDVRSGHYFYLSIHSPCQILLTFIPHNYSLSHHFLNIILIIW